MNIINIKNMKKKNKIFEYLHQKMFKIKNKM